MEAESVLLERSACSAMIAVMNQEITPTTLAPPAAKYAHAVLSVQPKRWLHTSGVVPVRPDGTVPAAMETQAEVVWANLTALLEEADMSATDVVSITTYVVAEHMDLLGKVMAARDAALGGHRAASTLITVPALARPEWKMEISLIAAR